MPIVRRPLRRCNTPAVARPWGSQGEHIPPRIQRLKIKMNAGFYSGLVLKQRRKSTSTRGRKGAKVKRRHLRANPDEQARLRGPNHLYCPSFLGRLNKEMSATSSNPPFSSTTESSVVISGQVLLLSLSLSLSLFKPQPPNPHPCPFCCACPFPTTQGRWDVKKKKIIWEGKA